MNNIATFNYALYGVTTPFPVPFLRPCLSVCTQQMISCLGIPSLLNAAPNCSAMFDYTGSNARFHINQYDSSNNAALCHTITATPIFVQNSMEPYHGNDNHGICSGYVSGNIYIPPSQISPISFAPLAPPTATQLKIETIASVVINTIPIWLSEDCHNAMKKYICARSFLKPQLKTLGGILNENHIPVGTQAGIAGYLTSLGLNANAILTNQFNIPSYYEYDVCHDYELKCAELILVGSSSRPDLVPNCHEKINGINTWPKTTTQLIQTLPLITPFGVLNLQINSTTSNITTNEMSYTPTCPVGFAVPEEIDDRTDMIYATGCAGKCVSPLFTRDEWNRYWKGLQHASITGVILNIISLIVHLSFGHTKNEILITTFILLAMIESIWGLILLDVPADERLCEDETRMLDNRNGLTLCASQSVITLYTVLGMALCLAFESVNWHILKNNRGCGDVVENDPENKSYNIRLKQIAIVLILPLLPVIIMLAMGLEGYSRNTFYCFFNSKTGNQDYGIFYVWFFILMIIAFLSALLTIYKVLSGKHIDGTPEKLSQNKLGLTLHLIFVLFFSIIWGLGCISRFTGDHYATILLRKFRKWAICVFTNFDGTNSYIAICGDACSGRPSKATIEFATVTFFVASLFVSIIYFPSTLTILYHKITGTGKESKTIVPIAVNATKVPEVIAEMVVVDDTNKKEANL